MKINQFKEWKLDLDQETCEMYKDLKVCDTFKKNGIERVSDTRALNVNEIRQIKGWMNCQIEDYQLPEDWSGKNMIERLAYIIAAG